MLITPLTPVVPLSDKNPTQTTPYVTYILIVLNIVVFIYELYLASQGQLERFFDTWAVVPQDLTASFQGQLLPDSRPEWFTLVSSQFLHGGFVHLGGNMLFLWVFGNNVEDRVGRLKFLVFYLVSGALASMAQWYFDPNSAIPSLGASGAIAGVLGAYILRFPKAQVTTLIPLGFFFFTYEVPAWVFLGFWFVQQAFYGIASVGVPTTVGMENGGIAYWAHAGGFVVGAILGPIFGLFSSEAPYDTVYDND